MPAGDMQLLQPCSGGPCGHEQAKLQQFHPVLLERAQGGQARECCRPRLCQRRTRAMDELAHRLHMGQMQANPWGLLGNGSMRALLDQDAIDPCKQPRDGCGDSRRGGHKHPTDRCQGRMEAACRRQKAAPPKSNTQLVRQGQLGKQGSRTHECMHAGGARKRAC